MSHYNLRISIPKSLDQILVWPLLLLRRIWYGYSFRRIPLVNSNLHAIVDSHDFYELGKFTWSVYITGNVYHAIRLTQEDRRNRYTFMHRQIMEPQLKAIRSTPNADLVVDHINHNGLDNRRINLRLVTRQQNKMNCRTTKGSSRFKGVSYRTKRKKWGASICYNYKHIHLGTFNNEIDAALAYDSAASKYFGEYANLNFAPEKKEKGLRSIVLRFLSFRT